jgi:hypothetical protein
MVLTKNERKQQEETITKSMAGTLYIDFFLYNEYMQEYSPKILILI